MPSNQSAYWALKIIICSLISVNYSSIFVPDVPLACCSNNYPRAICNSPDDQISVTTLCQQLGYDAGTFVKRASNYCPEPHWSGSGWMNEFNNDHGFGQSYTCTCNGGGACDGNQATCVDIAYSGPVWSFQGVGVQLGAYTNNELIFIGCVSNGCSRGSFFCNSDAGSLAFGTTSLGAMRSLVGEPDVPDSCPYIYVDEEMLVPALRTYAEAVAFCDTEYDGLATIITQEELDCATNLVTGVPAWIGLQSLDDNVYNGGKFTYIDGTECPIPFTGPYGQCVPSSWWEYKGGDGGDPGRPRCPHNKEDGNKCVNIDSTYIDNDSDCYTKYAVLCNV